jgi:hypothetical protein
MVKKNIKVILSEIEAVFEPLDESQVLALRDEIFESK